MTPEDRRRYWAVGEGDQLGYGPLAAPFRYTLDAWYLTLHTALRFGWGRDTITIETRHIAHFRLSRRSSRHQDRAQLELVLTKPPKRLGVFEGHGMVRSERGLTVLALPFPPAEAETLASALREVGVRAAEEAADPVVTTQYRDDIRQLLSAAQGTYQLRREDRDAFVYGALLLPIWIFIVATTRPSLHEVVGSFVILVGLLWTFALGLALTLEQRAVIDPSGIRLERRIGRWNTTIRAEEITALSVAPYRHDQLLAIETARGKTRLRLPPNLIAAFGRVDPAVLGRLGLLPHWHTLYGKDD